MTGKRTRGVSPVPDTDTKGVVGHVPHCVSSRTTTFFMCYEPSADWITSPSGFPLLGEGIKVPRSYFGFGCFRKITCVRRNFLSYLVKGPRVEGF